MENRVNHLFVYGSLRRTFPHHSYKYICDYFSFIGNAKVKGVLYAGEYPAAIPTRKQTFIIGELYQLKNNKDFCKAMEQLDDYEEVNSEEGKVSLYRRELTAAICNNITIHAWIYWYNRKIEGQILIPSGDIMDFMEIKSKF